MRPPGSLTLESTSNDWHPGAGRRERGGNERQARCGWLGPGEAL